MKPHEFTPHRDLPDYCAICRRPHEREELTGKMKPWRPPTESEAKRHRQAYMREYQKRRRAKNGTWSVTIELTQEEHEALMTCVYKQRGPKNGAYKRFLLTGAKFVANSGTKVGAKVTSGDPGCTGVFEPASAGSM